jgi:hypothetical protein
VVVVVLVGLMTGNCARPAVSPQASRPGRAPRALAPNGNGNGTIASSAVASSAVAGATMTPTPTSLGRRLFALSAGCGPAGKEYACNPVTNAGCRVDGEACDDDEKGGYACYPPPNEMAEGEACNDADGPSCAAGMACDNLNESNPEGLCRKLCCSNADCAAPKHCQVLDRHFGSLGFCR